MPNGSYGAMQRGRWVRAISSFRQLGSISAFRKNVLSFYEVDWLSRWLKRLEGRNQRKYKWALQALTCAARCYAAAAAMVAASRGAVLNHPSHRIHKS